MYPDYGTKKQKLLKNSKKNNALYCRQKNKYFWFPGQARTTK